MRFCAVIAIRNLQLGFESSVFISNLVDINRGRPSILQFCWKWFVICVTICKINEKLCGVHSYKRCTTDWGEVCHRFRGFSKVQGASSTQEDEFIKLVKYSTRRLMYCSHHCLASLHLYKHNLSNLIFFLFDMIFIWSSNIVHITRDSINNSSTFAIMWSIWSIRSAEVESRPEVGSSKNRSDGLSRISFPMHTLFLSPPETPLTNVPPISVSWHLKN